VAVVVDATPSSPVKDSTMNTRSALPTPFDVRVTRVLDEPMPDGAVIAVAMVAMGPVASINYRYTLASDGTLFHVRHSGKPGDWQVPFDQPLPAKPSGKVDKAEVDSSLHKLDVAGFFDHPGYEANPRAQDGSYVIIRARRGSDLHTVVFQNVRPDYVAELAMLPLRVLPHKG
jgi:hypothetical protein